jgi:hypothetical protein
MIELEVTAFRELSSPTLSERAVETARRLLAAPSPEAELDRLYPLLLRHHVAPPVLQTLRRAGGELAELSVASGLVASLRPFNTLLPGLSEDPPGRIRLAELAQALRRHAAHLEAVVQGLSDLRLAERFVLLFGAALRLVAPGYRRLSNDLDLYAPSAAAGVELARALRERWGFVLAQERTSPFHGRELAHLQLLRTTDDGHELHVDVIAGGRPARPGLVPAFVEPQLFERSRRMTLEGGRVRVPSTEDLLVWLAEKVARRRLAHRTRRRRQAGAGRGAGAHVRGARGAVAAGAAIPRPAACHLSLRDVHDAWVLAANEAEGTDWSRVLEASARHGLTEILSRLLALAEQVNGQIAIAPDVRRILESDRRQRTAGAYPRAELAG